MNSLSITDLALIVLLAPAAAAALIGIIGLRGLRSHSHWLAIAGVAIALVAAGKLFRDVRSVPEKDQATVYRQTHVVYEWFRPQIAGGTELRWFNVEFRIDPLTVVMLVTVLTVGLLVVIILVVKQREWAGRRAGIVIGYIGFDLLEQVGDVVGIRHHCA